MRKLLIIMALFLSVVGLKAQSISHIETTKNWYYIYDQDAYLQYVRYSLSLS